MRFTTRATQLLLGLLPVALGATEYYTKSIFDGSTGPGAAPGAPAGSYALSGFESVSLFNGRLDFALPLLEVGGRGEARYAITLKIDYTWPVESHVTCVDFTQNQCNPLVDVFHTVQQGWIVNNREVDYGPGYMRIRTGSDVVPCGNSTSQTVQDQLLTRFSYTMPDGTEYDLRDKQTDGLPHKNDSRYNTPCTGETPTSRLKEFVTADGSAATFVSNISISDAAIANPTEGGSEPYGGDGVLAFPPGVMYELAGGKVNKIRDRNGNQITFQYGDASYPWRVTGVIDALGRKLDADPTRSVSIQYGLSDSGGTFDQITFRGAEGTQRTIQVRYSSLQNALLLSAQAPACASSATTRTIDCLFPQNQLNSQLSGSSQTNSLPVDPAVVKEVVLPDGRKYEFKYNEYRELARVTLPTGGFIDYLWGPGDGAGTTVTAAGIARGAYLMVYRRVKERRVFPNAGPEAGRTVFAMRLRKPAASR